MHDLLVTEPQDGVTGQREAAILREVAAPLCCILVRGVSIELQDKALADETVDTVTVDHDLLTHVNPDPRETDARYRLDAGVGEVAGAVDHPPEPAGTGGHESEPVEVGIADADSRFEDHECAFERLALGDVEECIDRWLHQRAGGHWCRGRAPMEP